MGVGGEKVSEKAKKHAWKVVTDKAMGKKVHDNPKLLKQGIKKEERKHKKSVEKWKQRMKRSTNMRKQEKQEKRKENSKFKIEQKKRRKIEKREKRLVRPGFKGRKEGFINGA
ncbi:hypothetical protein Ancab_001342 [Ancistrocladus abbreviatus]